MFEKDKLRKIFRRAAASALTALCFAGSAGAAPLELEACPVQQPVSNSTSCDGKNHTPEKAILLTKGEAALVRSIFGKAVDASVERKYFLAPDKDNFATTCPDNGKSLEFYGAKMHSADYSHANIDNYGIFIHEMTHVWQFQTPNLPQGRLHCPMYDYPLDSKHAFSSYHDEQQAAIIEDYARHFLYPSHGDGYRYPYKNKPESYALLAKVVEDQFPEAQKTRLALEAKEKAKKPPQPNS